MDFDHQRAELPQAGGLFRDPQRLLHRCHPGDQQIPRHDADMPGKARGIRDACFRNRILNRDPEQGAVLSLFCHALLAQQGDEGKREAGGGTRTMRYAAMNLREGSDWQSATKQVVQGIDTSRQPLQRRHACAAQH